MSFENLPPFDSSTGPHSEKYFRAAALLKKLRAEHEQSIEDYKKLLAEHKRVLHPGALARPVGPKPEVTEVDKLVADVIDPEMPEGFAVEARETIEKAQELANKQARLYAAIRTLGDKLALFHAKACAEYCAEIRSEHYAPVATAVAKAVAALAAACADHADFVAELRRREVTNTSHLFHIEPIPRNPLYRALKSALEFGYLAKSEVPDQWLSQ
ncbi:hypothetical protein AMST5_03599 [freshwater sediment metagenome]|uniref:Uncharacterized protein n=1 Tax=freshwater sediment metagenome TaxID=556182 RepID=A0AA48M4W3_9ZZZZ